MSYDGRTGAAKDHDDIVDALAHAVAKCKGSLIGDRSELMGEFQTARMEHLRYVPLRQGGLGGREEPLAEHHRTLSDPLGGLSMGEALIEEDEVLTKLTARRDRIQEVIRDDVAHGRQVDQGLVSRVKAMTTQINELKEQQVL